MQGELVNTPSIFGYALYKQIFLVAIKNIRTIQCLDFAKLHYIKHLKFYRNYSVEVCQSQQMFLKVILIDHKHLQDISLNGKQLLYSCNHFTRYIKQYKNTLISQLCQTTRRLFKRKPITGCFRQELLCYSIKIEIRRNIKIH